MKRFLVYLWVMFLPVAIMAQMPVPEKPALSEGLVIDYTKTLSPEQKQLLNQKLIAYDDSTSNQVAIVIIGSTGEYPIEDMALQILRRWGVGGQEKKDNGILILVAKDDRKIRIEVGYGLEGAIPDMVAASIIDHSITPSFKAGNFYEGLNNAVNDIMKAAAGEYTAPKNYSDRKKGKGGVNVGQILLIMIILFFLIARSGGGRGGGMMSRRGYRGWWGPTIFPTGGWTGGSGGGGGGGGWSGGGGFGGFGGGSGGGGGASGSW